MKFTKISATGNDFILFDNRDNVLTGNETEFFNRICQRRLSVGADGILLIENSENYDFSLRYYNADGNIAEMCGNGARAASYYVYKNNISDNNVTFDVLGVVYKAEITGNGVKLLMPPPDEINIEPNIVKEPFLAEGGFTIVGVPHYVLFTEDLENTNVFEIGRKYRYHPAFQPKGTNTNFLQVIDTQKLKIRTYERGVEDETLACGTGTVASALISFKQKNIQPPIEFLAKGGTLYVDFTQDLKDIYLTGNVQIIFQGELLES